MADITNFEDDLFMTVRGIQVLKSQIRDAEIMVSGKLVSDIEIQLITELDRVWKSTFMQKGKYPDVVTLIGVPEDYFVPIKIRVHNPIVSNEIIDGRWDRPVWFRCKRNLLVQRMNIH